EGSGSTAGQKRGSIQTDLVLPLQGAQCNGTTARLSPLPHSLSSFPSADVQACCLPTRQPSTTTTAAMELGALSVTSRSVGSCSSRTRPAKDRLSYSSPCSTRAIRRRRSPSRSDEHTSELQSRVDLVCRLLLE